MPSWCFDKSIEKKTVFNVNVNVNGMTWYLTTKTFFFASQYLKFSYFSHFEIFHFMEIKISQKDFRNFVSSLQTPLTCGQRVV